MSKKHKIYIPLFAAILIAVGMLLQWWLMQPKPMSASQKKLNEIFSIISEKYVDEVDLDSIIELSIPGLLSSLDPHSAYIPASEREDADNQLDGSFSGIGIEFRIENDKIVVADVIAGGPGEKVGLMPGDKIVEINGEKVAEIGINEDGVKKRLRGEKGSKVKVKVEREGVKGLLKFEIIRGDVPVTSLDASYMLDNHTGYIKVNKFSKNTYSEFSQAVAELQSNGAKDYVIDLRGNVGGYMEPAILMANEFLNPGMTIVSTKGRDPRYNEIVRSNGEGILQDARVTVLVDELTASASEIFAGALQDNDRGLVLGRRTFGKGLVQQPIDLDDGSEIRLTIQRYYTPSGRSIQKNYKRGQNMEYEEEIFERYRSGELMALDSTKINFDLMFKSLNGRQLYGGGGLIPDIFVPNDSASSNPYYADIVRRGILQKFASEYVSLNRNHLMTAKDEKQILKQLPEDEILIMAFADYAKEQGVAPRWYYINNSSDMIVTQIKALIAYDILGRNSFFKVVNQNDNNVKSALEALREGKADFPIKIEDRALLKTKRH